MKKLQEIKSGKCPLNYSMISLVILKNAKSINSKTDEKTRYEDVKIDNSYTFFFKIILIWMKVEIEPQLKRVII